MQANNGDWSIDNAKKQEETGCKTLVSLIEILRGPKEGWPISLKLSWPGNHKLLDLNRAPCIFMELNI